jgi:hypothetical protein
MYGGAFLFRFFDFPEFVPFCLPIHKLLWNAKFQEYGCKPAGMSSSKTLDLKLFRMNIYRKTGRAGRANLPHWTITLGASGKGQGSRWQALVAPIFTLGEWKPRSQ